MTRSPSFHTLARVQRVTAILVGLALIFASGHVSTLHIHAYTEHDHPEHHHGQALHEHGYGHATVRHSPDDTPQWEGCDPSRHTISLTCVCATPPKSHAVDAEYVTPAGIALDLSLPAVIELTDVRVHGPPSRTLAPPRAPPLIFPA